MAHIPYGYRIENGKAWIDVSQADQIREFFESYLSGLSIKNALDQSGMPIGLAMAKHMLKNTTYLGDEYYPRILDDGTFQASIEERARRVNRMGRNHVPSRVRKANPVKSRFRVAIPTHGGCEQNTKEFCESRQALAAKNYSKTCDHELTPAQKAQLLYSCIVPCEDGDASISGFDKEALRDWIGEA